MNVLDLMNALGGEILANKARVNYNGKIEIVGRLMGTEWEITERGVKISHEYNTNKAKEAPKAAKEEPKKTTTRTRKSAKQLVELSQRIVYEANMISIDEFFPRVLPYVPGCSEPLARQAILDSAIRYCEKTLILRQSLDSFNTIKNLVSYDLESPNNQMRVARVLSVTIDGKEVKGIFEEDVPLLSDDEGKPTGFYTTRVDSEFVLNLYPKPDRKYKVVVTVALAPTKRATALEDDLYNVWSDGVIAGAIASIAKVPNMPFSSMDVAMAKEMELAKYMQESRVESYYGRVRGGTRVKTRPLVR